MLDGAAIRSLSAWCGRRELSWSAAHADDGHPVMMLKPRGSLRPWQRMMLVLGPDELRLQNELGETLASASDLPALLDAVDGGIGEVPRPAFLPLAGLARLPAAVVV